MCEVRDIIDLYIKIYILTIYHSQSKKITICHLIKEVRPRSQFLPKLSSFPIQLGSADDFQQLLSILDSPCSGQLNPDTWIGRSSAFAGGIPSLW